MAFLNWTRETKLSGVYHHQTLQPLALLTRGFDETFLAPHSRYADFPAEVLREYSDLDILAESEQAGAYLFATKDKRMAFVTGILSMSPYFVGRVFPRCCGGPFSRCSCELLPR
ncbi:Homoserine O-succinyltransferase [Hafnia alvei]|nr:Homoserine O-succinyltransferase [Hafnia alvei]